MADPSNNPPLTTPREYKDNPFEKQYAPKQPVQLEEAKEDLISVEELAKCNGMNTPGLRHGQGLTDYGRLGPREAHLRRNHGNCIRC